MENQIVELLLSVGVVPSMKGYHCLCSAIRICLSQQRPISKVSVTIYPKVAAINNSTPSAVERSIRYSLQTAWAKMTDEIRPYDFMRFLPPRANGKYPSNMAFISAAVEYLRVRNV